MHEISKYSKYICSMENYQNIIDLIAARQQELKYTNKKMASYAEIIPDYYAQIIAHKRPGVSFNIIEALCKTVGLQIMVLYNPVLMKLKENQNGQSETAPPSDSTTGKSQ